MKKTIALLLSLLATTTFTHRANPFNTTVEKVLAQSPQGHLAAARLEAARAENATGLNLPNPEIELGFLVDGSSNYRQDISVTQDLDLATLTGRRSALSKARTEVAASQHRQALQQLTSQIRRTLVDLTYANAALKLAQRNDSIAAHTLEITEQKLRHGQVTILDLNRARLAQAEAHATLSEIQEQVHQAQSALNLLAGGEVIHYPFTEFYTPAIPTDINSWIQNNIDTDPTLQTLDRQVNAERQAERLTAAESLPKLSAGFMSETVVSHESFNGLTLGLSIPLWQHRGAKKAAEARRIESELALETARQERSSRIRSLATKASSLQQLQQTYRQTLDTDNTPEILDRMLRHGQIGMEHYLADMASLIQLHQRMITIERDYAMAVWDLMDTAGQ